MSRTAREFAEAASMAMQVEAQQGPPPGPELLALLSLSYSMIEIAENLKRLAQKQTRDART